MEEEEEPQVTQVDAECAGKDKLRRWQLQGKPLWYNCTDAATGVGQMICDMGFGNCASEASQSRTKGVAKDGVFTINVTSPTTDILESWWKRNLEKAATVASVPAKTPEAGPPGSGEHKAPGDTSSRPDSDSSSAVSEGAAGSPSPPPPATPGSAGANSAAVAAATTDPSAAASQPGIPLPLVNFKALHILPLLLLLHPNLYQIQSPQKAATTPPMNLQWSCGKRLLLRHRLSCPRPARTGVQRKAPKRTPPPTPPTLLPAKEILRRQACRLPFPLRPQRTRWRKVWELTPASMTPICMPCHRLFWLRSPTGHWAEEVNAGYKCQHSTTWICELLLFYRVISNRKL
uniref:Serine-alanine-and proline-rich protein n=1 Tax=Trypanosoma cruzi TaxID=5693 RepID=Q9BJX4_TRYCR|nr:serine-alanine-and proline-rich protein [Trypanosoma cruzi]